MTLPRGSVSSAALVLTLGTLAACGGSLPKVEVLEPGQRVTARAPEAVEYAVRGHLYALRHQWELAADAYRTAIDNDPTSYSLRLSLGDALAHVPSSLREGLMTCDLAASLDAPASDVGLCRSALFFADGDTVRALAILRGVPDDLASDRVFSERVRLGALLGEQERLTEARRWTGARPNDPAAHRALGAALEEEAPVDAAQAYGFAASLPSGRPNDAYRQVQLLAGEGLTARALEAARSCRQSYWEYWPCVSWEAVLSHRALNAPDTIAADTREALEHLAFLTASDPRQLVSSGREIRSEGGPALVRAYAQIVADTRSGNVTALMLAGWLAHDIEDFDLAIDLMGRALDIDESNYDALNFIGYTWADRGENLELAEEYIRRALFLRGDSGGILDSLAWVLYRTGRLDEALEVQQRAIALEGDNAVIWDHLGDIQHALGRVEDALSSWERALELATEDDEDVLEDARRKIESVRGSS